MSKRSSCSVKQVLPQGPLADDAKPFDVATPYWDFALLKSLPIGLLVADPAARIVFLNEYVEQTLGYRRDELLGQPVETLVPEQLRIKHADLRRVFLCWEEIGGPAVAPPTRRGYGRMIIESTMRRIGRHRIEYAPTGLKFRMEAPIEKIGHAP